MIIGLLMLFKIRIVLKRTVFKMLFIKIKSCLRLSSYLILEASSSLGDPLVGIAIHTEDPGCRPADVVWC